MTDHSHIPLREAKIQLGRIDGHLDQDALLIGGLAVQQYDPLRETRDIDLVCDHSTALGLIRSLYPNDSWDVVDENDDEYRPKFTITHKIDPNTPAVSFGPKIIERPHYKFLQWKMLLRDSKLFTWRRSDFRHIRVPSVEALCLSKIASFLGRNPAQQNKIEQDLTDVRALSNHREFRLGRFYNALRESGIEEYIRQHFWQRASQYQSIFNGSYLYSISELFQERAQGRSGTQDYHAATGQSTLEVIDLRRRMATRNQEWHFNSYEETATSVSAFSLATICGLLQSLDYATVILALYRSPEPRAGAHARIRRQEALKKSGCRLKMILHETVWRQPIPTVRAVNDEGQIIGPTQALVENLQSLCYLLRNQSAPYELGILSNESVSAVPLQSDYVIYDDSIVVLEGLAFSIAIRDPEYVSLYCKHFDDAWDSATKGPQALSALEKAISHLLG